MTRGTRLTIRPTVSLVPDQYTAAGNGSAVDLAGVASALVSITSGAYGGTASPSASVKVQESTDLGTTWTDVADSNLIGATGNPSGLPIAASTVTSVDYVGDARHIRVIVSAVAGTSPVIRLGANVILSHLRHAGPQPV